MFTATRLTADTFKGVSLPKFVEMVFPERIRDVIDVHLLLQEDGEAIADARNMIGARSYRVHIFGA